MNRQVNQLIIRAAINKIGNMLYDYGNSVWLASLGALGQTILGVYQISELVTSIICNPIGGVIADRFSRRKILMVTDLVCGLLCLFLSLLSHRDWLIAGLIFANVVQAVAFAFSRSANKSYITEVVDKEEIVAYNSQLEVVLQVVSVSSPVLSFLVLQYASLKATLILDAASFFLAFVLIYFLPNQKPSRDKPASLTLGSIWQDMREGLTYICQQRMIFFLLLLASSVNFFFGAFNYLLPFTDQLFGQTGAYASLLTAGSAGSILGALMAKKVPASVQYLLFSIVLTGVGVLFFAPG